MYQYMYRCLYLLASVYVNNSLLYHLRPLCIIQVH